MTSCLYLSGYLCQLHVVMTMHVAFIQTFRQVLNKKIFDVVIYCTCFNILLEYRDIFVFFFVSFVDSVPHNIVVLAVDAWLCGLLV